MINIGETLLNLWNDSGFARIISGFISEMGWQNLLMIAIGCFLLYLAIAKKFEPLLLTGIAFGCILTNLPGAGLYHQELWNQFSSLYGIKQDKEAIDQWHAINGDFEYDDKGNIIGLKGGEAEAAAEAANPNTTYQLGGVMNGKEVPKQLANVGGLTTTNVELFDSTGKLYNAAKVSVDRKNGYDNPSIDDKITYNLGGKEITLARGYSPYTRDMHPDAINGTFNGYQPNNVASYYDGDVKAGMLSKTGDSTEMNGRDVPIYATPDGKEWVYDAANNIYLEFEQKKEENKEN
jgi:hypothetical protein